MAARRAHADTRVLDHGRVREVGKGERLSIRSSLCLHGCSVALACALTLFGGTFYKLGRHTMAVGCFWTVSVGPGWLGPAQAV
ncbi:hypothetical protein MHYP_G00303990 [Metynnis hypsauchen]